MPRTTQPSGARRSVSRTGGALLGVAALGILMVPATGCGPSGSSGDAPVPGTIGTGVAGASASLLMRGRILSDTVVLEPVFLLDSARAAGTSSGARHRLVGLDREGAVLFETGVEGVGVADAQAAEEHFQALLPTSEREAARLHAVELRTADGRTARRTATLSAEELREALAAEDVLTARRTDGGRVILTWPAEVFPGLLVRDPQTRQVLAFARGGSVTLGTEREALEVVVSDGVRSASRIVEVR